MLTQAQMKKYPLLLCIIMFFVLFITVYQLIEDRNSENQFQQMYLNYEFNGIITEIRLGRSSIPTIVINNKQIPLGKFGLRAIEYFEIGDSIVKKKNQFEFSVYKIQDQKIVEFKVFKPRLNL